ncbi:MAG: hypothetical protein EOP07_07325 [Proteobacteria bacterium]|nr:MAG: hypothetical protein EOP07_07325 [Pseudomonadota bacterium]
MNSILLLSQLIIPTIPAGVNENNFIKESIATLSCVDYVEEDSVVHALDEKTGEDKVIQKLLVGTKEGYSNKKCAAQVAKEFDGLTVDTVFSAFPIFVVSYELPAVESQKPSVKPDQEPEFNCLAIGICPTEAK